MYSYWSGSLVSFAAALTLFLASTATCSSGDPPLLSHLAAKYAQAHYAQYGLRLPSAEFTDALRTAAVNISHLSCRKSLVVLGMANEEAFRHTVPQLLASLSRVKLSDSQEADQSLDRRVVLVAWSLQALDACRALQAKYSHKCVRDAEHQAGHGSFAYHDVGFNALGFAKVKYILNGLSLGHDVVFLDTDIVVLRNPLPYFLTSHADLSGTLEKCMVYNASRSFNSRDFAAQPRNKPPGINIGVLYFRATAAVTRCVYAWAWQMYSEVQMRPKLWDQDLYNKVMQRCTAVHELRWQPLDPRLFQSACYPNCGCTYDDTEVTDDQIGKFSRGHKKLHGGACGPQHWKDWIMRHFPCSGVTEHKAGLMQALLQGYYSDTPAVMVKQHE